MAEFGIDAEERTAPAIRRLIFAATSFSNEDRPYNRRGIAFNNLHGENVAQMAR
jgi:hypothetical protein